MDFSFGVLTLFFFSFRFGVFVCVVAELFVCERVSVMRVSMCMICACRVCTVPYEVNEAASDENDDDDDRFTDDFDDDDDGLLNNTQHARTGEIGTPLPPPRRPKSY